MVNPGMIPFSLTSLKGGFCTACSPHVSPVVRVRVKCCGRVAQGPRQAICRLPTPFTSCVWLVTQTKLCHESSSHARGSSCGCPCQLPTCPWVVPPPGQPCLPHCSLPYDCPFLLQLAQTRFHQDFSSHFDLMKSNVFTIALPGLFVLCVSQVASRNLTRPMPRPVLGPACERGHSLRRAPASGPTSSSAVARGGGLLCGHKGTERPFYSGSSESEKKVVAQL